MSQSDVHASVARARERRTRVVALAVLFSVAARVVTLGTQILLMPLLFKELGEVRYGAWAALSAALAFAPFLDFGAGTSVLARVARDEGRGQVEAQRHTTSTAFAILCALSLALLAVVAVAGLAYATLDAWHASETTRAGLIAGAILALGLPLSLSPRLQLAVQRGAHAGLFALIGGLVALLGSLLAVRLHQGLLGLAVAAALGPLAAGLGSTASLLLRQRPDLRPRRAYVSWSEARALGRDMVFYSILQAAAWAVATADPLLIAFRAGKEAAARYAVTQQWLLLPAQAISLFVQPMSSAFGEAWGRHDVDWARRALRRSVPLAALAAALGGGLIVLVAPWIVSAWTRGAVRPDLVLMLGLLAAGTAVSTGSMGAAFLNALGVLRPQVILAATVTICGVGLKVAGLATIGLPAVGWASAISYFACVLVPYAVIIRRLLRQHEPRPS